MALRNTKALAGSIRGKVPIRAARPHTRSLEAAHSARVLSLMTDYREIVYSKVNEIIDYLSVPVAPRFDDPHDIIERVFADLRVRVMTLFDTRKMERLSTDSAIQISNTNGDQFRRMVKTVLKVDPMMSEPWLIDEVNKFVIENVSLIRSIPEKGLFDVEQMLYREAKRRLSPKEIMAKLREQFDVTEQRAELIAIDQVLKFNGSLTELRQRGLGVKRYTWRTVGDQRVRGNPAGKYPNARPSHYALDGQVFEWKNPPVSGTNGEKLNPGMPIRCRCVRSDLPIYSPSGYLVAWRRRHRGTLTVLHLEEGETLAVTPNHPLATERGLIAANSVDVGDYVIAACNKRIGRRESNPNNRPASGDEVFNALRDIFPVEIRAGECSQFHGDGADGEVEVIRTDAMLSSVFDAGSREVLRKFLFTLTDQARAPSIEFPKGSPLAIVCAGFSGRSIGAACQFAAFIKRNAAHAYKHRSTTISWGDAKGNKTFADYSAINTEFFRELLFAVAFHVTTYDRLVVELLSVMAGGDTMPDQDATASQVARDGILTIPNGERGVFHSGTITHKTLRVIDRRDGDYDGHVVNFQTGMGFYYSSGMALVANCYAEPIFDDIRSPGMISISPLTV